MASQNPQFLIKQNLFYVLKYQYFYDLEREDPEKRAIPQSILGRDIQIGYPDIYVWFSNKDCAETLELGKQIWEQTPKQLNATVSLDDYLNIYTDQVCDKFQKFEELLAKLKQINKIQQNTRLLLEKLSRYQNQTCQVEQLQQELIRFNFQIKHLEENDLLVASEEDRYHIEITYQDKKYTVAGEFQKYSNKLIFDNNIYLDIPHNIGTLQMNLIKQSQNQIDVVASRNLDPFTTLSSDWSFQDSEIQITESNESFPLKIKSKNEFLNLQMKIDLKGSNQNDYKSLINQRLKYLEMQYDKNFKKCYLYKTKLRVLLKPFSLVKFNDNGIYFQKLPTDSHRRDKSSCAVCNVF